MRSKISIDLGALRRNAARLLEELQGAELWAVVKADGYGHGARDAARAALEAGAAALCVVTVPEGVALREVFRDSRILVMGPTDEHEQATACEARLELVMGAGRIPENVVGLMTRLATADTDTVFAGRQLELFREATDRYPKLIRHAANSAAALR